MVDRAEPSEIVDEPVDHVAVCECMDDRNGDVNGSQVQLNGCGPGVAGIGDAVYGNTIVSGSPTVCAE